MDALDFLRVLLNPDRLAVVGLVAAGPHSAEELVQRTGVTTRAVLATLAPLVQAGIVQRTGEAYALRREALQALARELPQPLPPAREVLHGMTPEEQAVLGRFFRDRRLKEIPTHHSKRRVVLERLALDFEPGVRYPETQVNALLQRYHADYAALRRYLVDEGLLERAEGRYWRSGGRVQA
ncbi:MAG: DUF2087 domain-containing protein [Actinomycetota bacterium]|nr:DUF2087 domain-containing protein [Actinomycetota bacterium]